MRPSTGGEAAWARTSTASPEAAPAAGISGSREASHGTETDRTSRVAPRGRSATRATQAALKNREIEKRGALDDAEATRVLQGLVKQREDSIFQFRRANRPELVQKEQAELDVLKAYLPEEASAAEIEKAVDKAVAETGASSPKDIGRAMKAALA